METVCSSRKERAVDCARGGGEGAHVPCLASMDIKDHIVPQGRKEDYLLFAMAASSVPLSGSAEDISWCSAGTMKPAETAEDQR